MSLRKPSLIAASALGTLWCTISLTACLGVHGRQVESDVSLKQAEAEEAKSVEEQPFQESLTPGATTGSGQLFVTTERRFQTLEGFGASVAWYQNLITGPTAEGLYDFLFPELGLDILRFRNRFERSTKTDETTYEEVEIFQRATEALGRPPRLLLTSWSPPASLKASGKEKCRGEQDCTLKREDGAFVYAKFADWWRRSISSYRSLGLDPEFVSMQNEPDFIPHDWEGCKFEPAETPEFPGYGKALELVHAEIQKLPNPPKMLGPETLGIHYHRVPNYLSHIDQSLLHGVAHHIYERGNDNIWDWRFPGPDSYVDEMLITAAATSKPLYQTEFQTDEDKGIDGGFETAWLIHHSLSEEGVVAFLYWDLVWNGKQGLVSINGGVPTPRDQYYAMRHYSRFTDPGDVRVGAAGDQKDLLASAYLSPDEKRLTIVALNVSLSATDVTLNVDGFPTTNSAVYRTSYRPGHSRRWEELGSLGPDRELRMPARAVATIVLER